MRREKELDVSKYAVYTGSRIYHAMIDEDHTKCGVHVFASSPAGHSQDDWSLLKIVGSVPAGLRFCPHCSGENSIKKGNAK